MTRLSSGGCLAPFPPCRKPPRGQAWEGVHRLAGVRGLRRMSLGLEGREVEAARLLLAAVQGQRPSAAAAEREGRRKGMQGRKEGGRKEEGKERGEREEEERRREERGEESREKRGGREGGWEEGERRGGGKERRLGRREGRREKRGAREVGGEEGGEEGKRGGWEVGGEEEGAGRKSPEACCCQGRGWQVQEWPRAFILVSLRDPATSSLASGYSLHPFPFT